MTTKELLYIEDALGHEKYFKEKCKETAAAISDPELRAHVTEMEEAHAKIFNSFYSLLP